MSVDDRKGWTEDVIVACNVKRCPESRGGERGCAPELTDTAQYLLSVLCCGICG
ncbi:hypothetical protein BD779DRAFT_1508860 [Infundibulicybe gibba]|nr:hypothetical protein BD779DRAFT_1508860 [Infundibulicybe gibba]